MKVNIRSRHLCIDTILSRVYVKFQARILSNEPERRNLQFREKSSKAWKIFFHSSVGD